MDLWLVFAAKATLYHWIFWPYIIKKLVTANDISSFSSLIFTQVIASSTFSLCICDVYNYGKGRIEDTYDLSVTHANLVASLYDWA